MKIKNLFIIGIQFVIELFTVAYWFTCKNFTDFLSMSSINLTLHLEDLIHTDKGVSPKVVRIFHNKPLDFFLAVFKRYLLFWDVRFFVNLFSIIGYFGIFCGFYYLFSTKKKKWYMWGLLGILLILPFTEIFFRSKFGFELKLILLSIPYLLFSCYGIWKFLQNGDKWRFAITILLLLLSLWWYGMMKSEVLRYCSK